MSGGVSALTAENVVGDVDVATYVDLRDTRHWGLRSLVLREEVLKQKPH